MATPRARWRRPCPPSRPTRRQPLATRPHRRCPVPRRQPGLRLGRVVPPPGRGRYAAEHCPAPRPVALRGRATSGCRPVRRRSTRSRWPTAATPGSPRLASLPNSGRAVAGRGLAWPSRPERSASRQPRPRRLPDRRKTAFRTGHRRAHTRCPATRNADRNADLTTDHEGSLDHPRLCRSTIPLRATASVRRAGR
jgi:hypothetical protein